MNEEQWRESADPGAMLSFLADRAGGPTFWRFVLACCHRVNDRIIDRTARAALDGLQALACHDQGPEDSSVALAAARKASDHAAMAMAADGVAAEACAAAAAHSA